jgi:hypothetical protein
MSKTLVLEMPDEVFANVERVAASEDLSTEDFILELILQNIAQQRSPLDAEAARIAEERFMSWFGSVSLRHPIGTDNEKIDADLAREYAATHEERN